MGVLLRIENDLRVGLPGDINALVAYYGRMLLLLVLCFCSGNEVFAGVSDLSFGSKPIARTQWEEGVNLLIEASSDLHFGRFDRAQYKLIRLLQTNSLPYLRNEARERLVGLGQFVEPRSRISVTREILKEAASRVEIYVGPEGSAGNPGTRERPLGSLDQALGIVRRLKEEGRWPLGGVVIVMKPGIYRAFDTLVLGPEVSGDAVAPLVIRGMGHGEVKITGGIRITNLVPYESGDVGESRIAPEARKRVWVSDLTSLGFNRVRPLYLGGCASGRGFMTHPVWELFWNGSPLPMARWPNSGYARIQGVNLLNPIRVHSYIGSRDGVIYFKDLRLTNWAKEPEGWLHGYWFWNWADSYEKIQRIDTTNYMIYLAPPVHNYGFRIGQPFRAVNMLCELDEPGEWYLDRQTLRIYVWPPSSPANAEVWLSVFDGPFLILSNSSHVRLENITFEYCAGDAVHILGGESCEVVGCVVRNCGGDGIVVRGGKNHSIVSSDLFNLGRGGIILEGGDRKALVPAGHVVRNCHIHHISRIDHTYTPAVLVKGVGQVVSHCLFHDINSSALRVDGNDHLIEYNEVFRVVLESDDQGAVDMWGDPTYRGVVFRHNYFHHIGGWNGLYIGFQPSIGRAGIRLDDAISGVVVYGNLFYRASVGRFGAIQIHGGKENIVDNNLFVDCHASISLSGWASNRWYEFVKDRMSRIDVDWSVYLARYPDLRLLIHEPNVNYFSRNVAVGCDTFILRDDGKQVSICNLVATNNPGVDELSPGTFRVRSTSATLRKIGFKPISATEVGLYIDSYRRRIPWDLIRAARNEGGSFHAR